MKHIDDPQHIIKLYDKNKTLNCIWRGVEKIVLENIEHKCIFWEPYIFAPHTVWLYNLRKQNIMGHSEEALMTFALDMIFMGTFRYTKDVYKFDSTLLTHLINTPLNDVNAMALTRLPEYCVYVALDGIISFNGKKLLGFYAVYDDDLAHHRITDFAHFGENEARLLKEYPDKLRLRFLYDDDEKNNIYSTYIPLRDGDICDIWQGLIDLKKEVASHGHVTFGENDMLKEDEIELLKKVLPILFYLCSDQPEIKDRKCSKIKKIPHYEKDKPKRIFSPSIIRYWDVGKEIGRKLSRQSRGHHSRGGISPHLRRAHWHGFWKGCKDEKVMHYKWLPPIFVNPEKVNQSSIPPL